MQVGCHTSRFTQRVRFAAVAVGLLLAAGSARGQFVEGDWVQRGEAAIRQYRTTPVKFLVLDAQGRIAGDATVRIEQTRHAFDLGWQLRGGFPEGYDAEAPLWRVFNAVSLEPLTAWRSLQPTRGGPLQLEPVDAAIDAAKSHDLSVRWGTLVPGGEFDLPDWVVPLRGRAYDQAARQYADLVLAAYDDDIADIDLTSGRADAARPDPATIRMLGQAVETAEPAITTRLSFDGALQGPATFDVLEAIDAASKMYLGLDGLSIRQSFAPEAVDHPALEPAVLRVTRFGQPMTLGGLEVPGANPLQSSINLEVVLRTLFAEPMIDGIYFRGLTAEDPIDPSAALIDSEGKPTGPAETLDRLFHEAWWTRQTLKTDDLGEASTRVFLGRHHVEATLPDGSAVSTTLRLDYRSDGPRLVVLQPVADAAAPPEPAAPGEGPSGPTEADSDAQSPSEPTAPVD